LKKPVNGGAVEEVKKAVTTVLNSLSKFFDKFQDVGIEILSDKTAENGVRTLRCQREFVKFTIILTPKDDSGTFADISFQRDGGKKLDIPNVPEDEVERTIKETLESTFSDKAGNSDENTAATASRKLRVTLQRITSAKETTINLTAIHADYEPSIALQDLDAVLDNEDFLDIITDAPVSFEINDEGDDYDIQPIEDFDTSTTCEEILKYALLLWSNVKTAHWNAIGTDFFTLHDKMAEYNDCILEDIDFFGELAVEFEFQVDDIANLFVKAVTDGYANKIDNSEGYTSDEGFFYLKDTISAYADVLDLYSANFPGDVQSEIDGIIRYWRKEADYKLRQQPGYRSYVQG